MLVELLPEQIATFWSRLRGPIEDSLPPMVGESKEAMSRLLEALLSGRGRVWVYVEEDRIKGMVVTTPYRDPLTNAASMLIYSAYAFEPLTERMFEKTVQTLWQDARDQGLKNLMAFSANEALVRLLERNGADASYRIIELRGE